MTDISTRCGGNNSGTPFVAGELRGYRTWLRSHPDDVPAGMLPLRSVHLPYVSWTPILRARCLAADYGQATKPHQVPAKGCRCGIYGWYRPRDRRIVPAPVFGVVAASGAIIMGTHGFRAEQATIVAIVSRDAGKFLCVYRRMDNNRLAVIKTLDPLGRRQCIRSGSADAKHVICGAGLG